MLHDLLLHTRGALTKWLISALMSARQEHHNTITTQSWWHQSTLCKMTSGIRSRTTGKNRAAYSSFVGISFGRKREALIYISSSFCILYLIEGYWANLLMWDKLYYPITRSFSSASFQSSVTTFPGWASWSSSSIASAEMGVVFGEPCGFETGDCLSRVFCNVANCAVTSSNRLVCRLTLTYRWTWTLHKS